MESPRPGNSLRIAYFFTRFPHATETFIQREVRSMMKLGLKPELHSFHGGAPEFDGAHVIRFSKWRLIELLWRVPMEWWRRPREVMHFTRLLFTGWTRDWINYWENLYGAGVGAVLAAELRERRIEHIHAVWASLPAMAAWVISRLNDSTFSMGAHAYDLFEHGGDWFLREKCAAATFVHTSTDAGRRQLIAHQTAPEKIVVARRGLDRFPEFHPHREKREVMRIVCVARLVAKKGLLQQMGIYRRLRDLGFSFEARIIGDGPLRLALENEIRAGRLGTEVRLMGHLPSDRVWAEMAEADVLVHTGVITSTGDRDGLPNVVPEAMASGAVVVTAPGDGVLEAIENEVTGLVCPLDRQDRWIEAFSRVRDDAALAARLRVNARHWVEEHFDADHNAALIFERFFRAVPVTHHDPAPASAGTEFDAALRRH